MLILVLTTFFRLVVGLPVAPAPTAGLCATVYREASRTGGGWLTETYLGQRTINKRDHAIYAFAIYYEGVGEWEYGYCADAAPER